MRKNFLIEVLDGTRANVKMTKTDVQNIPNFGQILGLDWFSILSKSSSISLKTNEPLKKSEILQKLSKCFQLIENSGIIGNPRLYLSGVSENSEGSELIETPKGNVRYIRLLLEYNSGIIQS